MCSHQVSLGAHDTIRSKHRFKRLARSHGVSIDAYHGDNGIFVSREFRLNMDNLSQNLTLSGVGAHHQNAIAERQIRTIVECARTMLHHAALQWPDVFDQCLWPFALDYSCWLYNLRPDRDSGWTPLELFSKSKSTNNKHPRARVFMCPCYVPHSKLQDGKSIPKWEPHARLGQFLGFSLEHSSLVGLIHSLLTNHISPQFHLINDEKSSTIDDNIGVIDELEFDIDTSHLDIDDDDATDNQFLIPIPSELLDHLPSPTIIPPASPREHSPSPSIDNDIKDLSDIESLHNDFDFLPSADNDCVGLPTLSEGDILSSEGDVMVETGLPITSEGDLIIPSEGDTTVPTFHPTSSKGEDITAIPPSTQPELLGRGMRTKYPNQWIYGGRSRFAQIGSLLKIYVSPSISLSHLDWTIPYSPPYEIFNYFESLHIDSDSLEIDWWHPLTLAAKASSVDEPRYFEVLRLPSEEIE
jgi:hypothetical protein